MKILWLRPTKPENVSVGRERIARILRNAGDEVTIEDASKWDSLRATYRGMKTDYDVIVGTVRMGLYVGLLLSVIKRTPLLADVTDPIDQVNTLSPKTFKFIKHFENFALRQADARVFLYSTSYERANSLGIDGVKLNNGVNYELFQDVPDDIREEAKNRLGDEFDPSKKTAVYIGGLEQKYNIEMIIKVAGNLPEWNFAFVGSGSLSGEVSQASNTKPNVFYPGSVDYDLIPGMLSVADVGLCLVDAEQPIKVLEYGAAGLPTIAVYGELENRFSEDSLYFIPPTYVELEKSLRKLGNSKVAKRSFGKRLQRVAEEYSWNEIGNRYRKILLDICR